MEHYTTSWLPDGRFEPTLPGHVDGARTIVLAFGLSEITGGHPALVELHRSFANSVVVGCSTAGQFIGTRLDPGEVTVAICRFEHTDLTVAVQPIDSAGDSEVVGSLLGAELLASSGGHPSAVLVLSDGLRVNGTALVAGLGAEVTGAAVFGGLAGDGTDFTTTWVLAQGEVRTGVVAAVLFSGQRLRTFHGRGGGGTIFGPERRVTHSDQNVLYSLDGRPALSLYRDYLGELASGLPATALLFPLMLRSEGPGHAVVRTVLSIDDDHQSMTFAGDLPEGSTAQLMRATPDELIDGSLSAAQQIAKEEADHGVLGSSLVFGVSCIGRRLVLGERTDEELEAVVDTLGAGAAVVGFYSYGEISPAAGVCELHNHTMTLTSLVEV